MKKMIRIIALLIVAIGILSFEWHKFYVSIADIKHNSQNNHLELSIKVFTDDLEKALQLSDSTIRIDDQASMDKYKEVVANYLVQHISVENGATLNYLGAELEFDVTYLFLESDAIQDQDVLMQNSIFTDVYSEQVNVVNITCKKEVTSYLFHADKQEQEVTL
jgi:hypothetical protein